MAGPRRELALETSTRTATVAVAPSEGTDAAPGDLVEEPLDTGHAHASDLVPAIARALGAADAMPRDIARVYVGLGPGSYTGLRVAVAAAVGVAIGADPPELFGVPSAAVVARCRVRNASRKAEASRAIASSGRVGAFIGDSSAAGNAAPMGARTAALCAIGFNITSSKTHSYLES